MNHKQTVIPGDHTIVCTLISAITIAYIAYPLQIKIQGIIFGRTKLNGQKIIKEI